MKLRSLMLALVAAVGMGSLPAQAVPVDLELVLAVDVSSSVNSIEYAGQRDGYVNAFNDSSIQNTILDTSEGRLGRIAVTYVEWSSAFSQQQRVSWSLIDSIESAQTFASSISGLTRSFGGSTGIGAAIEYSSSLFSFNQDTGYEGARKVIDISGDGRNNSGVAPSVARDNALTAGVSTINAIAIQDEDLEDYFVNNVIGGDGAFATFASNFEEDFTNSIGDKIFREVTGGDPVAVPEPATLGLLGLGLLGVFAGRRKV